MRGRRWCVLGSILLAAAAPTLAKKAGEGAVLADGFPPVTEAERALTEVPFAKGAPAVVLQDVRQHRWDPMSGEIYYTRIDHHRRLKILTQAGVEQFADFTYHSLVGDEEVQKVLARTVLPDGKAVPAQVFKDWKEGKHTTVRVTFAQVQPGAILDLRMTSSVPFAFSTRVPMQGELPVLHARYVVIPPQGVDYLQIVATSIPRDRIEVVPFRTALGHGSAYVIEDIPALGTEPFLPPLDDARMSLSVIWKYQSGSSRWASTWAAFGKEEKKRWDAWTNGQSLEAKSLAHTVAEGKGTPLEKAEAIRAAAYTRVRATWLGEELDFYAPEQRAPDLVLSTGRGTTADVAGLHVAMLRSVGLAADVVATRRRDAGRLDADVPMPILLDDMLVRLQTDKGPVYYNPTVELPVGMLPWRNRGVLALPLDGVTERLLPIPDFRPSENRVVRTGKAELLPDGTLTGETTDTHYGVAATRLRGELRDLDETKRRERIEADLRRLMPGCSLGAWSVEDGSEAAGISSLVVKRAWEAPGLGSLAGKRLLLNLNLHERVNPGDFAAESRIAPVDMGEVFDHTDTLSVTLPEGFTDAALPAPVSLLLGDPGSPQAVYTLQHQRVGRTVVLKRRLMLGERSFEAAAWPGLRGWFHQVVDAEAQPVAVLLP